MADAGADDIELEKYLEDPRFHKAWERFGQSADDDIREVVSSLASANVSGTKVAWDKKFRSAIDAGETKYDDKPYDGSPFIRIREIAYWIFTKTFDLNPQKANELATELEHHAVISAGLDWGKHQDGSKMPGNKSWPPIDRSAFLYMSPKERDDKQCRTCYAYAKDQKRCALIGPDFEVLPDDSCGVQLPGEFKPGMEIRRLATPEELSFIRGTQVRCENCRYGGPKCEWYVALNEALPDDVHLEEVIEPRGCCNAFMEKLKSAKPISAQQAKPDGNQTDRSSPTSQGDGWRGAGDANDQDGE